MKMVTAIIKHTKLDEVREALMKKGVVGMTTVEVKGFGRQLGHKELYRGTEVQVNFLPKIKIEVAVEGSILESVIEAIMDSARTSVEGSVGDGKIFVHNLENVVRIRTGETGREAI
jgi:nitrogen regulatory protein P-II 2